MSPYRVQAEKPPPQNTRQINWWWWTGLVTACFALVCFAAGCYLVAAIALALLW